MDFIAAITKEHLKSELPVVNVGDTVRIAETRKLSKDKNWRIVEIVEKAK